MFMSPIFNGKKPNLQESKKRLLNEEASPHRYLGEEVTPLRRGESPLQPGLVGLGLRMGFRLGVRVLGPI